MSSIKKHFVIFYSPGSFVAETTTKEVDSWCVETAKEMAANITERHNSKPYGFSFFTKERTDEDLDSHISDRSPMYYLGGTVETYDQIRDRNDPKDRILLENMKWNKWPAVVTTYTPWKCTRELHDDDVVLGVWNDD